MYVYGGDNNVNVLNDGVWQFNFNTLRWTPVATTPGSNAPPPRSNFSYGYYANNALYIFGGTTSVKLQETVTNEVWTFNFA